MSNDNDDFVDIARRELRFLESDLAFVFKVEDAQMVAYFRPDLSLRIGFDEQRSCEIPVWFVFGHPTVSAELPGSVFSLAEVLEVLAPNEGQRWTLIQASTKDKLESSIKRIAESLRPHMNHLLSDLSSCQKMLAERQAMTQRTVTAQIGIRQLLDDAQSAWQRKNYAEYVRLLDKERERLPELQKRRLRFALTKCGRR